MDVDGGFDGVFDGWFDDRFNVWFDGGLNGGFNSWFHLTVLGYQPQQSIWQLKGEAFMAISREGLGLVVKQTPRFTDSLTAISQEGIKAFIIVT